MSSSLSAAAAAQAGFEDDDIGSSNGENDGHTGTGLVGYTLFLIDPTIKQRFQPFWHGFYYNNKVDRSGRRWAKCSDCFESMVGRSTVLIEHRTSKCPKMTNEAKLAYSALQSGMISSTSGDDSLQAKATRQVKFGSNRGGAAGSSRAVTDMFSRKLIYFTEGQTKETNKLLLMALESKRIPYSIVTDHYFREWIESIVKVAGAKYSLPSETELRKLFSVVHADKVLPMIAAVDKAVNKTIMVDGWKDISGKSINALVAKKMGAPWKKAFLGVLELFRKRHTAEQLYSALDDTIKAVLDTSGWNNVGAIVTDNPSVMRKLRRIVSEKHSHVVPLWCVLHILSNTTKDFLQFEEFARIVKQNAKILSYFDRSNPWGEALQYYQDKKVGKLVKFSVSRWYGVSKTSLSIDANETNLQSVYMEATRELAPGEEPPPEFDEDVARLIYDTSHFLMNKMMILFVKPVADAVANLEHDDAHMGDVLAEFIKLFKIIEQLVCTTDLGLRAYDFNLAKRHCLKALSKRTAVLLDGPGCAPYIMALTLTPQWRSIAVSKAFSASTVTAMMVEFASTRPNVTLTTEYVSNLRKQFKAYLSNKSPFCVPSATELTILEYWSHCKEKGNAELANIALTIFEWVPHSAPVETLFSTMGDIKTKKRNRIEPERLTRKAQLKLYLDSNAPPKPRRGHIVERRKKRKNESGQIDSEQKPDFSSSSQQVNTDALAVEDVEDTIDDNDYEDAIETPEEETCVDIEKELYLKEELEEDDENMDSQDEDDEDAVEDNVKLLSDFFDMHMPLFTTDTGVEIDQPKPVQTISVAQALQLLDSIESDNDDIIEDSVDEHVKTQGSDAAIGEGPDLSVSIKKEEHHAAAVPRALTVPTSTVTNIPAGASDSASEVPQAHTKAKKASLPKGAVAPKAKLGTYAKKASPQLKGQLSLAAAMSPKPKASAASEVTVPSSNGVPSAIGMPNDGMPASCNGMPQSTTLSSAIDKEMLVLLVLGNDDGLGLGLDAESTGHTTSDFVIVEEPSVGEATNGFHGLGELNAWALAAHWEDSYELIEAYGDSIMLKNVAKDTEHALNLRFGVISPTEAEKSKLFRVREFSFGPYFPQQKNSTSCPINCVMALLSQSLMLTTAYGPYGGRLCNPWGSSNLLMAMLTSMTTPAIDHSTAQFVGKLQLTKLKDGAKELVLYLPAMFEKVLTVQTLKNFISSIFPLYSGVADNQSHIKFERALTDVETHRLLSAMNGFSESESTTSRQIYLGYSDLDDSRQSFRGYMEFEDLLVARGANACIVMSSSERQDLDEIVNYVGHETLLTTSYNGLWVYYDPFHPPVYGKTLKELFHGSDTVNGPNRILTGFNRRVYFLKVPNPDPNFSLSVAMGFAQEVVQNFNDVIDHALTSFGFRDYGMKIPRASVIRYDRKHIVPYLKLVTAKNFPGGSSAAVTLAHHWQPLSEDIVHEIECVNATASLHMGGTDILGIVVRSFDSMDFRVRDFESLQPTRFITDTAIEASLNLMRKFNLDQFTTDSIAHVFIFNTYFMDKLWNDGKGFNYDAARSYKKAPLKPYCDCSGGHINNIFQFKVILVPVNIPNSHWLLLAVYPQARKIYTLDSMFREVPASRYGTAMFNYLVEEYRTLNPTDIEMNLFGEWELILVTEVPQQASTSNDCGAYCTWFAESINFNIPITARSIKRHMGMGYYRKKMAARMLKDQLFIGPPASDATIDEAGAMDCD